ncbi:hypothetical protein PVAP13_2KG485400 [Panicum virgatum]|uniref:Equilibrative nucleotide transporter 3 n=2 Tax=Panicum virgatum TaxID=38727 RepID=A0A8T0W9D0_PANVG|nr:hypothetical protein PVAP13_2KG485400 [Panicum virgatum]
MADSSSYSLIPGRQSELGMEYDGRDTGADKTEGKSWGIFICWVLGNGCLFGFNGMLTIEDYYTYIFPKYHPTRIITLTYQPFVLATTAIFTYHEAKVNTRLRNLAGYMLFFLSSFGVIILDVLSSGGGGIVPFVGVCIIAAAFGIADGHVQGGMTGDLSLMCPEFVQSFFAGLAASGAITSALRFFTKAVFENSRDGLRKGATDYVHLFVIAKSCMIVVIDQCFHSVISRFLLIPAFYFTAKYGDQGWMIMLTSLLGLSNGHLTVCVLTEAPKGYKGPEQNALGNLLVLFLLAGIFVGAVSDWLWLIGKGW